MEISQGLKIPWAVYEIQETPPKKTTKLVKHAGALVTELEKQNAPTIAFRREEASNTHAFHIMHHLHHKNILCMSGIDGNKSENGYVTALVEPTSGLLSSICDLGACADRLNHIPSEKFQSVVREILHGLEFLRENGEYHGNLSWDTTLYLDPSVVKLSGFKSRVTSIGESWLNDRLSLAMMLQEVSTLAHASNKYVCDHVDGLIQMLQIPNVSSLDILDNTFFWDMETRTRFFTNIVSMKLEDEQFKDMLCHSHVCELPWKSNAAEPFRMLVECMESYCAGIGLSHYNEDNSLEFLMCICECYTHRYELMELNIDTVIRKSHPRLCIYLKRLVDEFDSLGFVCNDISCEICHPLYRLEHGSLDTQEALEAGDVPSLDVSPPSRAEKTARDTKEDEENKMGNSMYEHAFLICDSELSLLERMCL